MNEVGKNLGHATAYGYAKSKGYTGTEEEFAELMADYAEVGERAEAAATAAAASATAASGSASDSAASATAAAGSSTAASTAAGNASQAATTATTKASEAAQSATAAAGSATTASTKAGEAAQSATQAAASATAAESAKTAAQAAQTAAETAKTAAETAQGAAEDAAESVSASAAQIAQNTADISSVKNALGATLITDTASGAIATFPDGSDGVPMRSVTVDMEPVQDLHGQANPWTGGGGKNILDVASRAISDYLTTPKTIRAEACTVTKDGDTLTCIVTGAWSKIWLAIDTSTLVNGQTYTVSAMFSNPSGNLVGVSWFDTAWHNTVVDNSTSVKLETSFTYDSSYAQITLGFIVNNTTESTGNTVVISEMQLEKGSTASSFAPYSNICPITGRSEVGVWREATYDTSADPALTVQLGQTVYGGTVDVVSGVLTVDRAMVQLDGKGANYWNKSSKYPGGFYFDIDLFNDYYHITPRKNTPFLCSHAKTVDNISNYVNGTCYCDGSINIRIMSADTTVAQWVEYLVAQNTAGTPVEICCYLAQPVTVQLTAQQLTSLLGTNNVWSDGGNVSVEYVADTKAYIAKVIAAALA